MTLKRLNQANIQYEMIQQKKDKLTFEISQFKKKIKLHKEQLSELKGVYQREIIVEKKIQQSKLEGNLQEVYLKMKNKEMTLIRSIKIIQKSTLQRTNFLQSVINRIQQQKENIKIDQHLNDEQIQRQIKTLKRFQSHEMLKDQRIDEILDKITNHVSSSRRNYKETPSKSYEPTIRRISYHNSPPPPIHKTDISPKPRKSLK